MSGWAAVRGSIGSRATCKEGHQAALVDSQWREALGGDGGWREVNIKIHLIGLRGGQALAV